MNDELYKKVKDVVDRGKDSYSTIIRHNKELKNEIIEFTSYLPETAKISERVYNILYPDLVPSICENNKRPTFLNIKDGYTKFCGNGKKCQCYVDNMKTVMKEKAENTTKEEYAERIEKGKKTCLERYGSENVMQNEEFKKAFFESYKEKTGYDSPFENPEITERIKKQNIEKYGSEYPLQNEEIRKKATEKLMELDPTMSIPRAAYTDQTGYSNPSQNPVDRRKQLDGMMDKYGVYYALQSPEILDKKTKKEIELYSRNHSSQRTISVDAWKLMNNKEEMENLINTSSIQEITEKLGYKNVKSAYTKIKEMGIKIPRSSYETEIINFLDSHNINYIHNDRKQIKPKELDFYLIDYNLAIEFNGVYWHSNLIVDNDYHLNKYLACKEKDIRLISINEDEWVKNRDLIKGKILNLIGKSERGLPARKLHLENISSNEANEFCEQYHIQGSTSSIIYAVGAFDSCGLLIGVMAFSKQRTTGDIELIRFCHDGLIHNGLFSKMLKYAIKNNNWDKIISFADLRYSAGNLYLKNGFIENNIIKPDYRYVIGNSTYHKSNFKKSLLSKKFNLDNEYVNSHSEREIMENLDIPRIYDIGKIKYILECK